MSLISCRNRWMKNRLILTSEYLYRAFCAVFISLSIDYRSIIVGAICNEVAVLKFMVFLSLLFVPCVYADSMDGCYLANENITSFSSEESEIRTTYVKIVKTSGDYFVEGLIWGANFHICHVASSVEGSDGPLRMEYVENKLVYTQREAEDDINCKLEFSFQNNRLTIEDANHHCSRYIFYCGALVGLDKVELPKVEYGCP